MKLTLTPVSMAIKCDECTSQPSTNFSPLKKECFITGCALVLSVFAMYEEKRCFPKALFQEVTSSQGGGIILKEMGVLCKTEN